MQGIINLMAVKKVYVVGNLLVEQDSLPMKLLPELKKQIKGIEFV